MIDFDYAATKLRRFFKTRGFKEVHTQDRLSILAACEDPFTIAAFKYDGQTWPLPQTGQMWLEQELLKSPKEKGFFCVSTSFRNEPNPIPGRHLTIFPMFEFETRGVMEDLNRLEIELLEYLGFTKCARFTYKEACEMYSVKKLESKHEEMLDKEYGPAVFISEFPELDNPFWNMKRDNRGLSNKIDVILHGMETIGSAERSTDPQQMKDSFLSISDGNYAKLLFASFGKERVMKELDEFLSFDFFPRCGGGIGMTRLIRALNKNR